MRILLSGGGTAGHINPAIAIAKTLLAHESDSSVLFVGTPKGMEQRLVKKEGFDIKSVEVMGLRRSLTAENIKVAINYFTSIRDAGKIIDDFKPDVVVGTGGYVCAPVVKAAFKRKIPTLIHEQNVFPGLAIKMLAKKADVTAISFDETRTMMKGKNLVLTGNPLRPNLFDASDGAKIKQSMGLDSRPMVLIFGGSLGAERINDALVQMLKNGRIDFNIVASTGEKHYEGVMNELKGTSLGENVKILPYIYNMNEIFAAADLVVSRGGAITVSEINALGKAAIIVPSPYVAHDHQTYNAKYLEKNGAAILLPESELNGDSLKNAITAAVGDEGKLEKMRAASKKIGITDGCEAIYGELKKIIKRP